MLYLPSLDSTACLQQFLKELPGLWKLWSVDLRIVAVSDKYLSVMGLQRSLVIGQLAFDTLNVGPDSPSAAAGVRAAAARVLSTGLPDRHPVWRHDLPRPDGKGMEPRYWGISLSPIFNGNTSPQYVLAHIEDLTEYSSEACGPFEMRTPLEQELIRRNVTLQAALERMRVAEERYSLAGQAANDAVWDWDIAADVITWPEAFETLFGWDDDEVARDFAGWAALIHESDRDRIVSSLLNVLYSRKPHWKETYKCKRCDGSWATVTARGFIVRDRNGIAIRMVGGLLDVSDEHQPETEEVAIACN